MAKELKVYSFISGKGKDGVYHPLEDYGREVIENARRESPEKTISDEVVSEEVLEKLRQKILRETQRVFNEI